MRLRRDAAAIEPLVGEMIAGEADETGRPYDQVLAWSVEDIDRLFSNF